MNFGDELTLETAEVPWTELQESLARGTRLVSEAGNVDAVTDLRKRFEEADAVIEFDCRPMEIVIFEQVVHADADLQDPFVEMADLVGRRPPQQLEGLVLIEELACVELMNGFGQLRRSRRTARRDEVSRLQAFDRAGKLGMC